MVLRPLCSSTNKPAARPTAFISAWDAVARRQKQAADRYWLVTQPDHAALSGDIAANFVSAAFPHLDAATVRAVALHDAGWSIFPHESTPGTRPPLCQGGKPLSFVEFAPAEFLRAWTGSIERAASETPVGGIMVSRHFCALAEFRLDHSQDNDADRRLVRDFVVCERLRQQRLAAGLNHSAAELEQLVSALQFCDLLSLFLCCGADDAAEFPQRFAGGPVRIRRAENPEMYILNPSPFQSNPQQAEDGLRIVSLGVNARLYPSNGEPGVMMLSFLIC